MNMKTCKCCIARPPSTVPLLCGMVQAHGGQDALEDVDNRIVGPDYLRKVPDASFRGATPLPEPKEPSAYEIAKHMLTHLPYCGWCKYCIAGRRPNADH